MRRKGQVFALAAIIFGALFLLVALPAGPKLTDSSDTEFREFFQQSFKQNIDAFNRELAENRSLENVKRGLYSYNRFILESASSKGMDFESYQLAVLPEEGESVLINYRDTGLEANLSINGSWTNTTVASKQYLEKNFTPGSTNVTLHLDTDDDYSFSAYRPRLAYWMRMDARDESWQKSRVR